MLTLLRAYLDDTQSDRFTSNTILTKFLNLGQEEIQKIIDDADEHYFICCQNYAVIPSLTSLEFSLPTNFKKVVLAERVVTSGDPIPADWVAFQRRHLEPGSGSFFLPISRKPLCYLLGTKIGVVKPTDSYTLRLWFIHKIPELTQQDQVSRIPLEYHNLVVLHATKLASASEGRDFLHQDEYDRELARLETNIEMRQEQEPRYVTYIQD